MSSVRPIGAEPFFGRGLDLVQEPVPEYLPDRGEITPTDLPRADELDALLFTPNLDAGLYDWARPPVDRENLTGSRFQTFLGSALPQFHGRGLKGAASVLENNEFMNAQVWAGRHALIGG
jgi:hypothetical protein